MGVEIKLTDRECPVSPVLIDFLHRTIDDQPFDANWHDQLSEELVPADTDARQQAAQAVAERVLAHPLGQKAVYRAYEIFTALLTGVPEKLRPFHERYRFLCVVGCPRHGGSYLTKQLFRAVGMSGESVPNAVAHDGFPDASPFKLDESYNSLTVMMQNMAEYLAMVEVYFANSRLFDNFVVVPKKATKAAYHGDFFQRALGPNAEYIITLRHPLPACISTYEKSTGLPDDGKFKVRGNIEEWMRRDNTFLGASPERLAALDYFEVYLRYWEQYHHRLAVSGLAANPNWTVVAYGRERVMGLAQSWFKRFRSKESAEDFRVFDTQARHREWRAKADAAVHRVALVWRALGLDFPTEELMEAW